jgi:DUF1680 family protein
VARLLASLPGYFYSLSTAGAWVHQYAAGRADLRLLDGREVTLHVRTGYPWGEEVEIEVQGKGEFALLLRVPGWCAAARPVLEVNGRPFDGAPLAPRSSPAKRLPGAASARAKLVNADGDLVPSTYARLERAWRPGDIVRLRLPMPVRRVACHPYVAENAGRVALFRGPLLYCLEGVDQPGVELRDVVLPAGAAFQPEFLPELLGGVVVLRGVAEAVPPDAGWAGRLYRPAEEEQQPAGQPVPITAIPYYAWANRGANPMQVWLRE